VNAHAVSPSVSSRQHALGIELAVDHTNGNVVVIVNGNQVTQLQVTGGRGSLAGNALHSAAITKKHVSVVVDQLEAGLVEDGCSMRLRNCKANSVGETLTKRASGDFNTGSVMRLGVAGSDAIDLLYLQINPALSKETIHARKTYTEGLQIVHAHAIAKEVEQSILEHAAVAIPR